jgi:hypothetical protein
MRIVNKIILTPQEAQTELNLMAEKFLNKVEDITVYEVEIPSQSPKPLPPPPEFLPEKTQAFVDTFWLLPAGVRINSYEIDVTLKLITYFISFPDHRRETRSYLYRRNKA